MLFRSIEALAAKQHRTDAEDEQLDDLKDTLAQLSGLESDTASEVDKRLGRVVSRRMAYEYYFAKPAVPAKKA